MAYNSLLLIDDDEDDHEIFLTAIGQISTAVNCMVMNNAAEAIQQLLNGELNPEIIFVDLNMPVMTGEEFLVNIKKNVMLKHIPVIVYTTSSNPSTIALMKSLGAAGFITKPSTYNDVIDTLRPFVVK